MNDRELGSLRSDGFTDEQIDRLVVVRERYRNNEYSDETQESKRLLFVKWLHEHSRIDDGAGTELTSVNEVLESLGEP